MLAVNLKEDELGSKRMKLILTLIVLATLSIIPAESEPSQIQPGGNWDNWLIRRLASADRHLYYVGGTGDRLKDAAINFDKYRQVLSVVADEDGIAANTRLWVKQVLDKHDLPKDSANRNQLQQFRCELIDRYCLASSPFACRDSLNLPLEDIVISPCWTLRKECN